MFLACSFRHLMCTLENKPFHSHLTTIFSNLTPLYPIITQGEFASWFPKAQFMFNVLASLNSAINPIIYGVLNETYRKAICLLFPKLTRILMPNGNGGNRTNRTQQTPRQPGTSLPVQAIYDQNIPRTPPSFAIQSYQARQCSSQMKF